MRRVNGFCLIGVVWLCIGVGTARAGGEAGKKIFEEKKCIACHSLGDQKGAAAGFGGSLDNVGSRRDAAWLRAYLIDPKSHMPDSKMPPEHLADQDLQDLVQYLLSLKQPEQS